MKKQTSIGQSDDDIENAVKIILGRCLQGTMAFRHEHGYGIEGKPKG